MAVTIVWQVIDRLMCGMVPKNVLYKNNQTTPLVNISFLCHINFDDIFYHVTTCIKPNCDNLSITKYHLINQYVIILKLLIPPCINSNPADKSK